MWARTPPLLCRCLTLTLAGASAAACQQPGFGAGDDDASADDTTPGDDTSGDDDSGAPSDVVADATAGTLSLDFLVDAAGDGDGITRAIAAVDDAATLRLDGVDHTGFVYQRHDWQAAGYVLYDILSVAQDGSNLAVTYLYCSGDSLPYLYRESFLHAMDWETASGTCAVALGEAEPEVQAPALRALPDPFETGITIEGESLVLDSSSGTIDLSGDSWDLMPFGSVDCGTCPGGPWYEVHSLLVREAEVCFGILYLFPDTPDRVDLAYTLCLPTLADPAGDGISFPATWLGDLAATSRSSPPFRPLPPRRARDERP